MPTDSFLLREVFSFCHEFTLILKSKWRDLNSRLGGCRIYVSEIYFQFFWKIKKKKKTEVTLSLILRFNLRLEDYSIWSASTSRTIYDRDFGAWAPHSLEANGSTWRTTRTYLKEESKATRRMFWLLEVLDDSQPRTRRLQDSAKKSSGVCQTRDSGTAYRHKIF